MRAVGVEQGMTAIPLAPDEPHTVMYVQSAGEGRAVQRSSGTGPSWICIENVDNGGHASGAVTTERMQRGERSSIQDPDLS